MDKLIFFLKIVAWVVGIITTVLSASAIFGAMTYPGSIQELKDRANGKMVTFPLFKWLIPAIICWAFIIAF